MPTFQFDITNESNGACFRVVGSALPTEQPPEWGDSPTVVSTDISQALTDKETQDGVLRAAVDRVLALDPATLSQTEADYREIVLAIVSRSPPGKLLLPDAPETPGVWARLLNFFKG